MNFLTISLILFFSSLTFSQSPVETPLSDCRKKYFSLTDKSLFLKCATLEDFDMPKWCEKMKKYPLVNHLKAASDFVDLKGGMELLAIGMVGEGISVKDINRDPPRPDYKDLSDSNFNERARQLLTKHGYVMAQNGVDKGKWVLQFPDGSRNSHETIPVGLSILGYYGDSFYDDGSDTFGLEYNCLRQLGLIPVEFTYGKTLETRETELEKFPDFSFLPLNHPTNYRNEEASRFTASSTYNSEGIKSGDTCYKDLNIKPELYQPKFQETSYPKLIFKDPPVAKRKGDPGRTFYRTPEAQVFASAALWKLSQERLFAFKKELKLEREFSQDELYFWSKAFYNGAQGTQSGAYSMMKTYYEKGLLNNEDYLKKWPEVGSAEIYFNAKLTQETLKRTSTECFDSYPKNPSNKTYTRASDLKPHPSSSQDKPSSSSSEQ
jgi:hypothetical protein